MYIYIGARLFIVFDLMYMYPHTLVHAVCVWTMDGWSRIQYWDVKVHVHVCMLQSLNTTIICYY